ncbi:MAG: putative rane protein [Myxococcaceae bacterium]|nr:putative rane protein [Myxococcaceae bacterium]
MTGTPQKLERGAPAGDPLRSAVWSAAVASASLVAQHVAGKATRDTLFLSHFGLELLPAAMIGAALVSSVAVVGISRALGKYGPARIVPVMFGSSAALFLLEWWLSLHSERAAAVAVYMHTAIYGSAAVSAFWSLVNERFDPHSAKKIVGRIASGGTIGGVVGGVVVWRASSHLSVPMMLALLAGINVFGLWGALRTVGSARDGVLVAGSGKTEEPLAGGGWKIVRETPYLRDLALLVLAGAIIQALLDWLLSAHATHEYGKGPALLGFFALFNMIVGVLSFIAQTGLSRPMLEWRGLAGTVKAQPITVALCAVLALVTPHLWSVVLLRGGEAVTRNSLYRSAYELFYTPLPTAKKRATKTIIDVGVDRVGTTIGSVALLAIVHLGPDLATRAVLIGAIAMAALSWVVASRLHDGYVAALASSLKSGAVALGDDELADLTTRRTLAETTALLDRQQLLARIEQFQKTKEGKTKDKDEKTTTAAPATLAGAAPAGAPNDAPAASALDVAADPVATRAAALRTGDAARIKAALSTPLLPALTAFVIPLLADDAVVRDAVRALRKVAAKSTGQLLDALLDPDVDPRVRRRIPRVLKMCRTQRAANGLLMALRDPLFEVRVQVALGLKQMQDESHVTLQEEEVFDSVVHELTTGRAGWKRGAAHDSAGDDAGDGAGEDAMMRGLAHVFTVLGLVLEREPLSIAYRALRSADPGLRGTAFEYVEVVLPTRVRDVLVPLLGDVKPAARTRERGSKELADELLRSSASLARPVR